MTHNPVLGPEAWIAPTLTAVGYLALLLWAVCEVVRARHFSVVLRLGLLLLALAVPFLGPLVAAIAARQQRRILPER